MLKLKIEDMEFHDLARRIVVNTKSKTRNVWKEIAKKFVLHAAKFTPPCGKNPTTETFGEQRKIGQAAVMRDVHEFFVHLGPKTEEHIRLTKGWPKYWMDKEGQLHGIEEGQLAIKNARPQLHAFRNKHWRNGRLRSPGKAYKVGKVSFTQRMAAPTRNINAYAKWLTKRVFIAKSGWTVPAVALGQKLPAMITKHGGDGVFKQTQQGTWPVYTIGNRVPFIQQAGRELHIIRRALFASKGKMKEQLLNTIRKNALRKGPVLA